MVVKMSNAGSVPVGKGDGGGGNTLNSKIELPCIDGHCHLFGSSLATADKFHPWSEPGQVVVVRAGTQGAERLKYAPGLKVTIWRFRRFRDTGAWVPVQYVMEGRSVVEAPKTPWPLQPDSNGCLDFGKTGELLDLGMNKSKTTMASVADFAGNMKGMAHAIGNDGTNAFCCLEGIPRQSARAAISLLLDFGYTGLPILNVNFALWGLGLTPRCMPDPDGFYPAEKSYFWGNREGTQFMIESLAEVAARYPGEVWPLAPFDPRRAVCPPPGEARTALEMVKFAISDLGYAGVKLYSRCGWMPLENSKIHIKHGAKMDAKLRELYSYLVSEDLPVLNHTSPTGFPPEGLLDLPPVYTGGHPDIPHRPTELWSGDYSGEQEAFRLTLSVAWAAATEAANYCHYIQHTVSPYAWEPVLREFPTLRLCFAHSGGRVSALAKFCESRFDQQLWEELKTDWASKSSAWRKEYKDFKGEAKGPLFDLYRNPCVASGKWFRESLFEQCCYFYADQILQNNVPPFDLSWSNNEAGEAALYFPGNQHASVMGMQFNTTSEPLYKSRSQLREMIQVEIRKLLQSAEWAGWLGVWEAAYPLDWYSKIIELYKNPKYPNLYSDIAYYSGEAEPWFKRLLKPFVDFARQDPEVARKTIFGTDWWMTEMDSIDPRTFWSWSAAVIDSRHPMWNQWTSTNTIKWINLRKRMDTIESWCKKNNPNATMPVWWPALKKHYDTGSI
jgi:predicted TIM-barrel fold metal-dependent hydrolase